MRWCVKSKLWVGEGSWWVAGCSFVQLADLVSWLLVLTELADSWLIRWQALASLLLVRSVVKQSALSRTAGEVVE